MGLLTPILGIMMVPFGSTGLLLRDGPNVIKDPNTFSVEGVVSVGGVGVGWIVNCSGIAVGFVASSLLVKGETTFVLVSLTKSKAFFISGSLFIGLNTSDDEGFVLIGWVISFA